MPDLIYAVDNHGNYPVHQAAKYSHREVLGYLMTVTNWNRNGNLNEDAEERGKLLRLLINVIEAEFLYFALCLLRDYPLVATAKVDQQHSTALYHLAGMKPVFYKRTPFKARIWNRVYRMTPPSLWFDESANEPRQMAYELVRRLCDEMLSLSPEEARDIYKDAILKASMCDNYAVVEIILEAFPQAIFVQSDSGQSILHLAIENRNQSVFHFIYHSEGYKHIDLETRDSEGNNILHLAAKLPPSHILDRVSGPAIQMQMQLQWYQAVKKVVPPYCKFERNNNNETPGMIFKEEHSKLKMEAEKWMKDTANSCSIVAVLIVTIMFAATITVPGGLNNNTGFPIFISDVAFTVFVVGDTISLITSTLSLMIFLSTNTSGYLQYSFLFRHPTALISGFLTLFTSITFMMVAFTATTYLVLRKKILWLLIPTAIIAGLAVVIFWLVYLPLFIELFKITYGHGGVLRRNTRKFQYFQPLHMIR